MVQGEHAREAAGSIPLRLNADDRRSSTPKTVNTTKVQPPLSFLARGRGLSDILRCAGQDECAMQEVLDDVDDMP